MCPVQVLRIFRRDSHTIELDKVVLARPPHSPGFCLYRVDTHPDRLALAEDEDDSHRGTEDDENDAESAKSPSEIDIGVEKIGNPGAGKIRRNDRGIVETENDCTVLQGGRVGQDDGDDINQPQVANPVQGIGRSIGLDIFTCRFHNHTDDHEQQHGQKPFHSTPDVDDFGNGEVGNSTQNGSNDAGGSQEAVL